ncbi:MAG: (2Fe-2S)-binding protein [Gemmatimonadota bacterium]|nr:(2Fe-2S)-binding protein [Gemmatimonadota bacterium]
MPRLVVNGRATDAPLGRRLVLAIQEAGVEIGHRCGGKARCTTCRVAFSFGEPGIMTRAEYDKLRERGLLGEYRLSCQIVCSHDMAVTAPMTMTTESWTDPGPTPDPEVRPEAVWFPRGELGGDR